MEPGLLNIYKLEPGLLNIYIVSLGPWIYIYWGLDSWIYLLEPRLLNIYIFIGAWAPEYTYWCLGFWLYIYIGAWAPEYIYIDIGAWGPEYIYWGLGPWIYFYIGTLANWRKSIVFKWSSFEIDLGVWAETYRISPFPRVSFLSRFVDHVCSHRWNNPSQNPYFHTLEQRLKQKRHMI